MVPPAPLSLQKWWPPPPPFFFLGLSACSGGKCDFFFFFFFFCGGGGAKLSSQNFSAPYENPRPPSVPLLENPSYATVAPPAPLNKTRGFTPDSFVGTFSEEWFPLFCDFPERGERVGIRIRVILHRGEGRVVSDGIDDVIREVLTQELADPDNAATQILGDT